MLKGEFRVLRIGGSFITQSFRFSGPMVVFVYYRHFSAAKFRIFCLILRMHRASVVDVNRCVLCGLVVCGSCNVIGFASTFFEDVVLSYECEIQSPKSISDFEGL